MSGIFSTLNTATRGLNAQQTAIDVTSHNIANAKTDGYARQKANMESADSSIRDADLVNEMMAQLNKLSQDALRILENVRSR